MDADDLRPRQPDGRDLTLAAGSTGDLTVAHSPAAPSPEADGQRRPGSCTGGVLLDDGALRITRAGCPSRLVIAGDIDEFTFGGLISVLAEAGREPGEIHIDLAGVQFCDLAGLRALVFPGEVSIPSHDHSRRVVLHDFPAQLRAVLQIVGWDPGPGVVIAEPAGQPVIAEPADRAVMAG